MALATHRAIADLAHRRAERSIGRWPATEPGALFAGNLQHQRAGHWPRGNPQLSLRRGEFFQPSDRRQHRDPNLLYWSRRSDQSARHRLTRRQRHIVDDNYHPHGDHRWSASHSVVLQTRARLRRRLPGKRASSGRVVERRRSPGRDRHRRRNIEHGDHRRAIIRVCLIRVHRCSSVARPVFLPTLCLPRTESQHFNNRLGPLYSNTYRRSRRFPPHPPRYNGLGGAPALVISALLIECAASSASAWWAAAMPAITSHHPALIPSAGSFREMR
jgi:hypothetical protein